MILNETNNIISYDTDYNQCRGAVVTFNERTGELKLSIEARGNNSPVVNNETPTVTIAGSVSWNKYDGSAQSKAFTETFNLEDAGLSHQNWRRFEFTKSLRINTHTSTNNSLPLRNFGETTVNLTTVDCNGYSASFKLNINLDPINTTGVETTMDYLANYNDPKFYFMPKDMREIQVIFPKITINDSSVGDSETEVPGDLFIKFKNFGWYGSPTTFPGGGTLIHNGRKLDSTNLTPMSQAGGEALIYMSEIESMYIEDTDMGLVLDNEYRYTLDLQCSGNDITL